ncbi:hypothetical protein OB955_12370 [Halobacteria archaeon AArc-m2/3/4]|uniref:Uncharacterized protein n=1 Tax=Natronoglomus mannanivorans TaxID=2979990 RepID=A0AAP3E2I8_9EURY|nr:hypothetical protein [Halobacteria archaeon AArc-xg1-1]MCU4973532.1 hypothetical protein [Halobacteria archaeon AArc-m2/3/4]
MKYITSALYSRFEHPLLASLFIAAGVFAGLGVITQIVTTSGVAAGFFGVYAIVTSLLGILGYGLIFAVKQISEVRDNIAPHAN